MAADLDELEALSVYVLREAFARLRPLGMLWSLGKDSNVMIWLAKKAFGGHVPFPCMHIDTGKKFPEMYAFRTAYAKTWDLRLDIGECPPVEEIDASLPPAARSAARKTEGLRRFLLAGEYKGVIAGIRRDEAGVRAKERFFSPRSPDGQWNHAAQPPEFWDQFNADPPPGAHIRVHPLLHWTEIDIWRYIERENIPVVDLYFAKNGERYRSLGDQDITKPMPSNATTVAEIIAELQQTRVSERSGRAMDHEAEDAFERLRTAGYL